MFNQPTNNIESQSQPKKPIKKPIIAIIMAAGKGTRMQPLTNTTPKPLAKYNNQKTLLETNMDKIAPLVDEFVIVVHHLGQQIEDFIGNNYQSKPVSYTWTETPTTGTLDAFRQGIYGNKSSSNANFVVINADNIIGDQYYTILQSHINNQPDTACLMATQIQDLELLKASGVFVINSDNNLIQIVEKPQELVSNLVNIGLYYLPNNVFEFVNKKRSIQSGEEYITDLFNDYNNGNIIKILSSTDSYLPITTMKDLLVKAN